MALNLLRCTTSTTIPNNIPATILIDNGTSNIILTLPSGIEGVKTTLLKINNSTGTVTLQCGSGIYLSNATTTQTSIILGQSSTFVYYSLFWYQI